MRGMNARSKLALSIVVSGFDAVASKKLLEEAKCVAYWDGRSAEAYGFTEPPFLFKDSPDLLDQWQQGYDLKDHVEMEAQAPRGFTPEELQAISTKIKNAQTEAIKGCGLSDVLYEKTVQKSFASLHAAGPECLQKVTDQLLRSHGYDPEFEPYQAQEGECRLTGIDIDCCPCGRHE